MRCSDCPLQAHRAPDRSIHGSSELPGPAAESMADLSASNMQMRHAELQFDAQMTKADSTSLVGECAHCLLLQVSLQTCVCASLQNLAHKSDTPSNATTLRNVELAKLH